jgi:Na+/H+-dicarboxylate symporter
MSATRSDADLKPGLLGKWHSTPLYLRILLCVVLGLITGLVLGPRAAVFEEPCKLLLKMLGALAPPLIFLAILHALMHAQIPGKVAARLVGLLLLNTIVAIGIGLFVANVVKPGTWNELKPPSAEKKEEKQAADPLRLFLESFPKSIAGPFGDGGQVIGVIVIALAFGIALRRVKHEPVHTVADMVEVGLSTFIVVLHWLIELVPLAVFGVVASIIGVKGFSDFIALGAFVLAVVLALLLQATYYLVRVRFGSWVKPGDLLRGGRDALVMAFSTGSSTATMPVTYPASKTALVCASNRPAWGPLLGPTSTMTARPCTRRCLLYL